MFVELLIGQVIFLGDSGVDQLEEIIKVAGPWHQQVAEPDKQTQTTPNSNNFVACLWEGDT